MEVNNCSSLIRVSSVANKHEYQCQICMYNIDSNVAAVVHCIQVQRLLKQTSLLPLVCRLCSQYMHLNNFSVFELSLHFKLYLYWFGTRFRFGTYTRIKKCKFWFQKDILFWNFCCCKPKNKTEIHLNVCGESRIERQNYSSKVF